MLAAERDWSLPAHIDLIDQLLVRVAAGELKRLIVTVPVRHGKSEMCSRFFPAWLLGMRPSYRVVVAGYGAEFAEEWGEKARNLLSEHGPRFFGVGVSKDSHAKARWKVEVAGGGMFALGVGSPLTGRGANVLVIDDPFKNSEEADSPVLREKVWNWYWSTARTRLEPGGAIVILMARWHEDDLIGRLENHPEDVEPWTVVNLPALAEENDALGRRPGDALWPERFSQHELEATRKGMLPRWWSALYQQRPAPEEGILFKRSDFRRYSETWRGEPNMPGSARYYMLKTDHGEKKIDAGRCHTFQTVDVAASEKEQADYTVIATWAATPDKDLLLLDVQRQHFELTRVPALLARVNDEWDRCPIHVESFGHGYGPFQALRRDGRAVAELRPDTDKVRRAEHAVMRYEQHTVYHPISAEWLPAYEHELCTFPNAAHDDQVDVVAYAARLLPSIGRQRAMQDVERPHTISRGIMTQQF
jgi:predicted phage terminase large subunit-like protein